MSTVPSTLYIAVALLVVVVVRQFAQLAGSVLGILVAAGIGVWGAMTYSQGGAMVFLGMKVSVPAFFAFVALLLVFEALNLSLILKRRRRARELQQ